MEAFRKNIDDEVVRRRKGFFAQVAEKTKGWGGEDADADLLINEAEKTRSAIERLEVARSNIFKGLELLSLGFEVFFGSGEGASTIQDKLASALCVVTKFGQSQREVKEDSGKGEEMFKVGEVAKDLNVSRQTIRNRLAKMAEKKLIDPKTDISGGNINGKARALLEAGVGARADKVKVLKPPEDSDCYAEEVDPNTGGTVSKIRRH